MRQQFAPAAADYVKSAVHARGADLPRLLAVARLTGREQVLDVATATGHTALALAPHAARVVGVDLTPEMLDEARRQAEKKGAANVEFRQGDAQRMPFPDGSFDLVTCRIAAHHFPDVPGALTEMARVVKFAGRVVVIDNVVPPNPGLDRFMNDIEQRRDPSHVRAYGVAEWRRFFAAAGLTCWVAAVVETPIDFADWVARMRTPPDVAAALRRDLLAASPAARRHWRIVPEPLTFSLYKAVLVGRRRAGAFTASGSTV